MHEVFTGAASAALAAFLLALLGGAHCAGMCGGFVAALNHHRPPALAIARMRAGYHGGRVASYGLAGALVGALGGALFAADVRPIQVVLLIAGSAMLLAIGLSMFGRFAIVRRLEPMGAWIWKYVAPFARRVYPPRSAAQAWLTGLAWGWIPCGMVYAALPLALASGGPLSGALVMLAFGLGTLPNMLLLDFTINRIAATPNDALTRARTWLRPLAGVLILAFGISGLAHAAMVAGARDPAIALLASLCHR